MKKIVYTVTMGDQDYEGTEGEENRNHSPASGLVYSETDRCPICLNCLLEKEVGFPESCNHVFCMTCILKWAEMLASCPIDRKPFQAVFKFSPSEGCVKVQIKRQVRETKEKKTESSFKKQLSSSENYIRKKAIREDLLTSRFYDLKMMYRKSSNSKTGGQKNAAIKIDKPRRSNQCTSHCFRNFFSSMCSFSSHTGDSFTCRAYCTEFIEVSEISALITQKRQELELSWFPGTLPGIVRVGFVPWNVGPEVLPLISSVLPRSIFPTNSMSLENFGTCKGYTLAHTQEGDEKKQTSGSSNTRGSRRKPTTTTPTRRSTRNTRAETVSQTQKSPVSSNSGCDAPGNNIPSESVSSPIESEKQRRQAPKRKSVRRGRKPPLLKKKLRRSVPSSEKTSSSDSVEEEITESDTPPVLEKEQQSDVESSNVCSLQTDVENQLSVCLESCDEQTGENEEHTENHDSEEKLESSDSKSCNQDTSVLVGEEEGIEKLENTGIEGKVLCLENEVSKDIFEKESDPLENHDQVFRSSESEVKAGTCADHPPNDLLPCSGSRAEVYQAVSNSQDGIPENSESVISEEKLVDNLSVETSDYKDSAVKTEEIVESPKLECSEGEITQTVDKKSIESSEIELLGNVETENAEMTATCNTSENESMSSSQDSERNNIQSDKSLKEKTESPVEHPNSVKLLQTPIEQIEMHFSEDNNEMIPMECDSFCSDQNESEIESSVNIDSKLLSEDSVTHSSETNQTSSDPTNVKVETISQPSENPIDPIDKTKKPRTRKSRFHSPSTTWSPNKDATQEKKRSQSPSPKRETGKESKKSLSPSPKKESARGRRKSRSQSPRKDMTREKRRTQSRSPKRDSTRESKKSESPSPRRDTSRENRRSQSRVKDASKEKSRSRSRERESDRDGQRRERDRERERERRTRRWSRSRSRSRSPSRSRTKSKSSSFGRNERDSYSPRWKERWTTDGWRCPRGSDRYRKNDPEKQNENTRKEKSDVSLDTDDPNSVDKCRNDCPSWVTEKINSGPDPRTRNPEKLKDSHWEENRNENSGNSWNKNFGSSWVSNRGRGNRGRGTYRGSFAYTDQNENRWQNRKPLSGNSNSSGNDSFKYMEQQPYKRKNEQEFSFDTPADRSGWTSASSWAVRKNLPVDVQNYYSRRGRNSSGSQSGWMRQEEETTEQDSNLKDQTNQQVDSSQLPINMMQPQMNVIPQQMNAQHQPMNIFPYPMGVHAPLMNLQRSPFNMHPQLPLHLHTGVPLMQVAATASVTQGPPPPPPPPPPSQQVTYIASHPDGNQSQGIPSASHVSNNMSTPVLPAPTAAPGSMGTVQGPSSGNTPSSSHSKASNAAVKLAESKVSVTVEASADSSKTDKKLQIQEKAAQEVKLAIKPFYQNKDITKEEYKEIVRKAVDKVCHSKSGEVNSAKVANLVKAYVDKYKYSRKGSQKKTVEEPMTTEKNIG
ncbi:protein SCAF11 isoform X2 [Dipodomys spectabilis]|uniref:protein SCAF11 isoform X2 n=1 Tax=Dipodomys spectabilis TaxID=105255 RepID=UPI001C54216A|nr:protein SCAF11 isoform X2 [Dipodomys spectabilis]